MITQNNVEKNSGLKFENFELIHRNDNYYSLNGQLFAKLDESEHYLDAKYKLIIPFNLTDLFHLSDSDYLRALFPIGELPELLVTNVLEVKNKIRNNIESLMNVYSMSKYLSKGNLTILFKQDFSLKSVSIGNMLEFTFIDKNIRPSIFNFHINLLDKVTYKIRKDFDNVHEQAEISNCVFTILQEPRLITVIDNISVEYSLEELVRFKDLLNMMEY